MKVGKYLIITLLFVFFLTGAVLTNASPANYWDDNSINLDKYTKSILSKSNTKNYSLAPGDPVNFDAAQLAGADYLRRNQADITEDNAGNGNPDVPDDPDDGGWDWSSTTFTHGTGASPTNIYGATVMGVYYTYLESPDPALFTVMLDAADHIVSTGPAVNRSGADMKFLLLFNELYNAEVSITTVYADAAKAKYDGRISTYGSATALAEYIRDIRGVTQGYANGIIGWDIGIYSVVSQKLFGIYGVPYDTDADDIAEVLWQDSYNSSPGLFDIVADAGWDPTYSDVNFYWYTLGLTGLIDAFEASGSHTAEIPDLVTRLLASQFSGGGISFSYGANTDDEDWQSTGYTMMTLGNLDQATYQNDLNRMGYWIGATQDVTGAWIYGSGLHYPEIGGECTAGLYFTTNVNADVIADDDFASQADVDIYNAANSTSYVWGFNAFATIQAAIDAVNGSTVFIANGSYLETLTISIPLTLTGESEAGVIINTPPAGGYGILVTSGDVLMENFTLATNAANENFPIHASGTSNPPTGFSNLTLQNITISNAHRRTGFDIHGFTNVLLTNLTSLDAWGGNGLQITGCIDVTIDNITTSGNAWGSLAIYSSGPSYLNRGSDNVMIDGNTLSLGEGVLFNQDEFGLTNTNITVAGYEFMVRNLAFRPDAAGFYFYLDTYADAVISALGLEGVAPGSFIYSLTSNELFVADGMSIQTAIDAADPGGVINVGAGTYNERPIANKSVSIIGADEATVIVDAGAAPSGTYGFEVSANDVSISNLTLVGNPLASAPRYGFKPSSVSNFTLENVTGKEFYRTAIDLLGVTNGVLTNISAIDNNGHGLSLVDCNDVVITDVTVSGNAWQGVSVATWGRYSLLGTSDIVFTGTNSFVDPFQLEEGDFNNPGVPPAGDAIISYSTNIGDGAHVTIQASDFSFAVHGTQDDSPGQNRIWFMSSLVNATALVAAAPIGHFTGVDMYIEDMVDLTQLYVSPGGTIQAAIDAADPGDDVNILAGTYNERPIANKSVSIIGADEATVIVDAAAAPSGTYGFSVTANDVSISNLTLVGNPLASAPRYGFKPSSVSNFTLENVTGKEFYRTAIDLLGVTNGVLTNVSAIDNNGHGFSLVDCNDVLITDITASGNAWQGVSVATWGRYSLLGTSGIVFTGTNSFVDPFQLEEGDFNNPGVPPAGDAVISYSTNIGDGADVTIQASDFSFAVHGTQDDSPGQNRIWFMSSLVNATALVAAAPIGHFTGVDMYIEDLVDLTQLYVSPGGTIQAAIDAADPGDDVNVLAGTYNEGPQIHVDKSLAIIGQGSVTITPIANTGSSGDSRGWFLVDAGVLLDFSNVTLDGAGFNVYQGIRSHGGGTYDNITFQNFVHPGYAGVGLAVFGSENVSITNCTFTNMGRIGALLFGAGLTDSYFMNNTYTGKGAGDWLDYAVDISAGAVVTVDNCTITNCTGVALSDGSTSAGILVSTFYGSGTMATITNSILNDNTTGIAVGYDSADESIVNAHNNSIANNTSHGISTSGPLIVVNAEYNYWGSLDGPLDVAGTMEAVIGGTCYAVGDITNQIDEGFPGSGLGNEVSESVVYCPWIATDIFMSPDEIVSMCDGDFDIDVSLNSSIVNMKSISIRLSYPANLAVASMVLSDVNYASAPIFVWDNATGYDSVQVDMFVQSGLVDGLADLFTISFNSTSDICTSDMITMTRAVWKAGVSNTEIIAAVASPITVTADCDDPIVTINSPVDGGFYNATPVLDIATSDNCDIDYLYYQIDSDGWIAILSSYTGNSYADASWQLSTIDFDNLTEAAHCLQFRVVDDLGREGLSASWCFTKDVTAPETPTDFVAEPGHNKVKLSWTNSTSMDAIGLNIQRTSWGDYPTYSTSEPAYPSAYNDGTNIFSASGSSTVDQTGLNNTTRDVYYYSAFAYDAAGNYSAVSVNAQARSTSYWLGDIADNIFNLGNYDGFVHIGDLTVFASTYWKKTGDAAFIAEADFGPTVGALNSARGIPTPDDSISFTDLGVFAINYQSVDNLMKVVPLFANTSVNGALNLSLEPHIEGDVVLCDFSLNNNTGETKLVHLAFEFPENLVYEGFETEIRNEVGGYPIFTKARRVNNRIEFDMAIMGQGTSISGSGTLASFKFKLKNNDAAKFNFIEGFVLDNNLEELSAELIAGKIEMIPERYSLAQNYPNPFNPSTEIAYQLPQAGKVTLEVFNLLGQKVKTLVNSEQDANSYIVSWSGQNESGVKVSSGVYLYRLQINDFVQTKKMVLLK